MLCVLFIHEKKHEKCESESVSVKIANGWDSPGLQLKQRPWLTKMVSHCKLSN